LQKRPGTIPAEPLGAKIALNLRDGSANLQARIQRLSRMSLVADNAWSLSNEMTLPELASVSLWISSG